MRIALKLNIKMKIFIKSFFSILFASTLIYSCQTEKSIDKRYEEVVAQHDVVMPKISDMEVLQEKLRKKMKSLEPADSSQKEEILSLLSLLKKGHDGMFDWMNEFKNKHLDKEFYEKTPEAELRAYLDEEERKIIAVGETMLEGIKKSEAYLNQ
jgi:hypothetical protein